MFFLISVLMSSVSKGRNGTRGCPTATGSSFPALIHLLANTMGMEEAGHSFPPVKNLQAEQTEDQNPQIPMLGTAQVLRPPLAGTAGPSCYENKQSTKNVGRSFSLEQRHSNGLVWMESLTSETSSSLSAMPVGPHNFN